MLPLYFMLNSGNKTIAGRLNLSISTVSLFNCHTLRVYLKFPIVFLVVSHIGQTFMVGTCQIHTTGPSEVNSQIMEYRQLVTFGLLTEYE